VTEQLIGTGGMAEEVTADDDTEEQALLDDWLKTLSALSNAEIRIAVLHKRAHENIEVLLVNLYRALNLLCYTNTFYFSGPSCAGITGKSGE
jgi:hypothetical protein